MRRLRKKLTALLLTLPALLCACAGKPAKQDLAQPALDFRQALLENGCSFEAEITADFEDYVYSFTLSCEEDSDGSMQMRILAPDTLAGITAQIEGERAKLVFGDTEAAFGTLSGLGISPMAAPACDVSVRLRRRRNSRGYLVFRRRARARGAFLRRSYDRANRCYRF